MKHVLPACTGLPSPALHVTCDPHTGSAGLSIPGVHTPTAHAVPAVAVGLLPTCTLLGLLLAEHLQIGSGLVEPVIPAVLGAETHLHQRRLKPSRVRPTMTAPSA